MSEPTVHDLICSEGHRHIKRRLTGDTPIDRLLCDAPVGVPERPCSASVREIPAPLELSNREREFMCGCAQDQAWQHDHVANGDGDRWRDIADAIVNGGGIR